MKDLLSYHSPVLYNHTMTFNVVDLDPDEKPHVGSLQERIESVIYDYAQEEAVTMAEIIGVMEVVKDGLIRQMKDDE